MLSKIEHSQSESGGIGELEQSKTAGKGRSKWRLLMDGGTDSSEETGEFWSMSMGMGISSGVHHIVHYHLHR